MHDRVLIPLPGIGTLSMTRNEYEAALIPIPSPEIPKAAAKAPASILNAAQQGTHDFVRSKTSLRYVRLREVRELVSLSTSTICKLIAEGRFPKQVKLSERTSAWIESELDAYTEARRAERDEKSVLATPAASPYIRMGEVMRRTGLDNAALYELIRQRRFPKWAGGPKRGSLWLESEVDAWLSANKAQSE